MTNISAEYSGELKPCPLCGGQVKSELTGHVGIAIWGQTLLPPALPKQFTFRGKIKCPKCSLGLDLGQVGFVEKDDDATAMLKNFREKLAERWNVRVEA